MSPAPWLNPRVVWVLLALVVTAGFTGCATRFPTPVSGTSFDDGLSAQEIFDRSLAVHGGAAGASTSDVNLSITGTWGRLIQRIQPVVTDSGYRISAQERYRPAEQLYAVLWEGPQGTKKVVRTPGSIEVFYNGVRETDETRLGAAAMTADAFQLFHLGPTFLQARRATFERLPDGKEKGRRYYRLFTTLRPGFGRSDEDKVVLWVDPETGRWFRVHITLEGFETTRGAHVDVTFLRHQQVGPLLFPVEFHERVRGPIRISAHDWSFTGADLGRGWTAEDVREAGFSGTASEPAKPLMQR